MPDTPKPPVYMIWPMDDMILLEEDDMDNWYKVDGREA